MNRQGRRPEEKAGELSLGQTAPTEQDGGYGAQQGRYVGLWEQRTGIPPEEEEQRPGMTSVEESGPVASVTDVGNPPGMNGAGFGPFVNQGGQAPGGADASGAVNGFRALEERIKREDILEAAQTLQKYKSGKANLDKRIVENEEWYKLRHWACMRDKREEVEPASGWLFNCIISKHADAMDNFPSPNILPREESDKADADKLTHIVPVILDQCNFEQVYSDVWNYKLKFGTGVYGVFWDKSKLNGLGDVSVQKMDLLNLFWEPGITDIQKSRNIFCVELMDNDLIEQTYPQTKDKLGSSTVQVDKYLYDDTVDTSAKSAVVDWYYKKRFNGKTTLHFCKFVNDIVLYASENDPEYAERGWYDHGEYPFVFDPLYPTEGTPTGYSFIDVGKGTQSYIDRVNQAIMQNTLAGARPRYFVNAAGSVNEAEYADMTKDFIHVDGQLGQDSIQPVQNYGLSEIYVQVLRDKIEELKETTGNRDVTNGGTSAGVTAASGIAALQESSGKMSRDISKASYRAYRLMILQVIELIRQFYDVPRQFRILGESGEQEFTQYSNAGLRPQAQEGIFGVQTGFRLPLFDIEVTAQKASPYSRLSQNELAIQFYQLGFFNPQNADQSLACLDMMDFDRKSFIEQQISRNGTMLQTIQELKQQLIMLAAVADEARGGNELTTAVAQQLGMDAPEGGARPGGGEAVRLSGQGDRNVMPGENPGKESWVTEKARRQAAERTNPT